MFLHFTRSGCSDFLFVTERERSSRRCPGHSGLEHSPSDTATRCEISHIRAQNRPTENYIATPDCPSICFSKWQVNELISRLNAPLARALLGPDAIIGLGRGLGSTKMPAAKLYHVTLIAPLPKNARLPTIIAASYSAYALQCLLLIHFTARRLSTLKHQREAPLSITGEPCYFTQHLHSDFQNR